MSVILFNQTEINNLLGMLKFHEDKIFTQLEYSKDFSHYCKQYNDEITQQKIDFLGRTIWYAIVANKVAYALQYQENPDFSNIDMDYEGAKPIDCTLNTLIEEIGRFDYNIHTNDGNMFMEEKWYTPFCLVGKLA